MKTPPNNNNLYELEGGGKKWTDDFEKFLTNQIILKLFQNIHTTYFVELKSL